SGLAFADELETESTEAPVIMESLDNEPDSDFGLAVKAPVIEEEETAYADDDVVRVFIVFEDEAVVEAGYSTEDIADDKAAMQYSDELTATQEEVIEKIEDEALEGETLDTKYSFTLLTNAVSADVKYKELEEIEAVDGVSAVYIAPVYETLTYDEPQTMTAGEMVGSYKTWESGYTGAGMRVAVIDTGLDVNHPSFSEDGFLYGLNETAAEAGRTVDSYNLLDAQEIAERVDKLNASARYSGLTADDLYVNSKVPFGFNYVDDNLNLKHLIKSDGTHDDHGSHVAGIAVANKYINYDGEYKTQTLGVVGVAPDAQLFVMRVFGENGGAYSDDYMAAIEDAIILGADAINLSLGSANAGESAAGEAYIDEIFDRLVATDTVVSISAGNAGSWADYSQYGANLTTDVDLDTVGSPGSYTNAFTVASATNSSITGYAAKFNDTVLASYIDGSSAPNAPMTTLDTNGNGTEYEYVLIPAYGEEADFENVDVKGKIVLVSRGSISFYVKHLNAAKAGAAGLFVFNNTTGTISMNLTGSDATIPAASITLAAAQSIVESSEYDETNGTYTGKVLILSERVVDYNVPDAFQMSSFSSWGVPGDLALKPEITAPGGNIYSTTDDGTYDVYSGTSMAAPSVAGLSALVIQYIEENNLAEKTGLSKRALAQSLLMSTATPLVQPNGLPYSPRKQGAGLANAAAATTSQAYILVGGKEGNDGKVKIELGDDPDRLGIYSFEFDIYNFGDKEVFFKPGGIALTEAVAQDYFIANSSYKLSPKIDAHSNGESFLYDVDGNGKVSFSDVYALLYYINLKKTYEIVDTFPESFDFNGNGIIDTDDAATLLKAVKRPSTSSINLNEKVLVVKDKATVSVTVTLSSKDRKYLDGNFENGMYIEGYLTWDGKVDLSVPILGFYGNWSDASMFDSFDAMEYFSGDKDQITYNGVAVTNYLSYQFAGDSSSYYYVPNMYE
ncbi:MAG: S8 family serine peptidase, partial [Lachnospiraceae bacterium]|nr:S8 family serine peptidase [Lachnospiraceae bacterium]